MRAGVGFASRVCVAITALTACTVGAWPLQYYGQSSGRLWSQIDVPGTTCGAGDDPYHFFYAPEYGNPPDNRLVIYMEGGNVTFADPAGSTTEPYRPITSAKTIDKLINRISNPTNPDDLNTNELLFMQRSENDAFIGGAHWAFFPYCTQDSHSGTRTEAARYDFMNLPNNTVEEELEQIIEDRPTGMSLQEAIDAIEAAIPGLFEIGDASTTMEDPATGDVQLGIVEVRIRHRGRFNVEQALVTLVEHIETSDPNFFDDVHILLTGTSAGGIGAAANFDIIGDGAYSNPAIQLTLAPVAGLPITRTWSEASGGLVEDAAIVALQEAAIDTWGAVLPCERAGGAYTAIPPDPQCLDAIDLFEHFLARYPDRDYRYTVAINKADPSVESLFGNDELKQCKSLHRYGQELEALGTAVHPYMIWQSFGTNANRMVHDFKKAVVTKPIVKPNGGATTPYSFLGYLNELATRSYTGTPVNIENTANVIMDIDDPNSAVTTVPDYLPSCNVPWP